MLVQLELPVWVDIVERNSKVGIADRSKERTANKKTDAAKSKAQEDGWKGFVNVELVEGQKALVKTLAGDVERVWNVIWDLVGGGYKLTCSYDKANGAYNVSMTCRQTQDVNFGLTLTGRGGSVMGAAASFVFKHETILEGDWTSGARVGGRNMSEDDVG